MEALWDDMDQEEQINALRDKLNRVIEFIDNHAHSDEGFVYSKESIYSNTKAVGGIL